MDHDRAARIRALYQEIAKAHQQIEDEHAAALEDTDADGFSDGFTAGFSAGQEYAKAPPEPDPAYRDTVTFLEGWFAGARFERDHPRLSDIDAATTERLVQRIAADRAEAPEATEPSPLGPIPQAETRPEAASERQTAKDLEQELYRAAAKVLPEGTDHGSIVLFAHLCEAIPDKPTH